MKILILAFLTLLVSCGSQKPVINPNAPKFYAAKEFIKTYHIYGDNLGKRVFLTHGIWDTDEMYTYGSGLDLVNGLVAKGYQVVTFSYPKTELETLYNGGANYRADYLKFLDWMIEDAEAVHGVVNEITLGGFSFGGLHAMIGANHPKVNKYFGMLPAVDIGVIYAGIDTSHFNGFYEETNLNTKPGLVISGLRDTIAKHELSYKYAQDMGSIVDHVFVDTDHRMCPGVVNAVLNWL